MSAIEQVVQALVGTYRWGLHPLKVFVALVVPVLVVWAAHRRLRYHIRAMEEEQARLDRLPRIRRR